MNIYSSSSKHRAILAQHLYPENASTRRQCRGGWGKGRVYINKDQYLKGVRPEVWAFHIGGYQVCEKWLKDRRGRKLEYDDIRHYQKTVVALGETIRLMGEECLSEMFEDKIGKQRNCEERTPTARGGG